MRLYTKFEEEDRHIARKLAIKRAIVEAVSIIAVAGGIYLMYLLLWFAFAPKEGL